MTNHVAAFSTLVKVIETFRKEDHEIPAHRAQLLLMVALKPGISAKELMGSLGFTANGVSQNVKKLSRWSAPGVGGRDLIEATPNPHNTRENIHFLTPKGRILMSKVLGVLHNDAGMTLDSPSAKEVTAAMWRGAPESA